MSTANLFRDYATEDAVVSPRTFHKTNKELYAQDIVNYEKTRFFFANDPWFAKSMTPYVKFLEFATKGNEVATLNSLLYAYRYPGTSNSIIRLCQALFGESANIVLDETIRGVVDLSVSNANALFDFGWVDQFTGGVAIVDKNSENSWITFENFSDLNGGYLFGLIKEFIPAGWELILNIV